MFGEVISVDPTTGDGVILGEDQQHYPFAASACRGRLNGGQKVEFDALDGVASDIFKLSAARHRLGMTPPSSAQLKREDAVDTPLGYVRNNRGWGQLLWSPDGRINRGEFWKAFIVLTVANVLLGWIPFAGSFVSFGTTWGTIAIYSKRLHDMGHTGWLQMLPIATWIVAIILAIPALAANPDSLSGGVSRMLWMLGLVPLLIVGVANLGFLVWVGSVAGQSGPNRFGPDPKATPDRTAEAFA
ncbi:DUF805 domain-containing protein [Brevundimonas sp. Root1279]|uniref:DUF805 domain-containing protein n=1 Tax=Brevundimonas sp. Root1279 TaxID=1736443 RepID=UPI0006F495F6|nr:DUF805 domain-containing protein [Brevundimonas sp. Root1279]KQW82220.1 hypothetical protein ASC65_08035 [Brevundimonas sp. Root1279]